MKRLIITSVRRKLWTIYSKAYNYLYTRVGEVRKPRQRVRHDQILICSHIFGLYYKTSDLCLKCAGAVHPASKMLAINIIRMVIGTVCYANLSVIG